MNRPSPLGSRAALCGLWLLAACSAPLDAEPTPDPVLPTPAAEVSRFTADPRTTTASLWLEVALGQGEEVVADVWAEGLGKVFGYSAHVELDPRHLAVLPTAAAEGLPQVLGPDAADEAAYLRVERPSDVGLGGTLRDPKRAEVTLEGPVKLGRVRLRARTPGASALRLTRAMVRRADGAFVPVGTFGGTLVTVGGTP